MKKQTRAQKIGRWITNFVELQLFLSLISLPILIAWGLPISLLSPIANLIFNPLLTIFLLISSLLFFTELIGIPNDLLAWFLDLFTRWWIWILDWYHNGWLIGFIKPSWWFLVMIFVVPLLIMAYKKIYSSQVIIIAMSILFSAICTTLYVQSRIVHGVAHVAYHLDNVPILHYAHKTVVVDPGIIGKRTCAISWMQYTFIPELIKQTGRLVIDHLIIMQPSIRTFEALVTLSEKVEIKNIYLPLWNGSMPRGIWRHFFALTEHIKNNGGSVIRIGEYKKIITVSAEFVVSIEPLDTHLKYNEAQFRAWCVQGHVNNQPFIFYTAKYKGKKVIHSQTKGEHDEKESIVSSSTRGVSAN